MDDAESSYREAAAARALVLPAQIDDGAFTRCGTTDKPHGKDGAFIFYRDGVPAGGFENHTDSRGWETWCSKSESKLSALELREHRARVVAAKKARDEELARTRKAAAEEAAKTWKSARTATTHPYLVEKGVKAHGARVLGDLLVLTMSDEAGALHSLQTIHADKNVERRKSYLRGGLKTGCFYAIGDVAKATVLFVAEGFATGATVHEATGIATVVAFDSGNLKPVCQALRKRYPRTKLVICADDDAHRPENPGITSANAAAALVGAQVAVPVFGPERGGLTDFNDMAVSRGVAAVKALLGKFVGSTFASSSSRVSGEREERLEDAKHILRFGVKFLDDSMGGITRNDIVLIGAKYGKGKTQAASIIATTNASLGKRVHYFALEAEDREIERRRKYQILANLYYAEPGGHRPIRYLDWRNGLLEDELGQYDERADAELELIGGNLHTLYKDEDFFTGEDFVRTFQGIQDETDLVVLDHFHFVDSDDRDEIRAMKRNAQAIRRAAIRAKKPVVLVAHIRKQDGKTDPLVPTGEAFRGSSDLINIATKAVMIAPDHDFDTGDIMLWSTFMAVSKCRQDSTLERYVARMNFDVRVNQYRSEYTLGLLVAGGKKFVHLGDDKLPHWNTRPRQPQFDSVPFDDEDDDA